MGPRGAITCLAGRLHCDSQSRLGEIWSCVHGRFPSRVIRHLYLVESFDQRSGTDILSMLLQAMYANINDGYVEALVRGYRSGLLTSADYNNLSQCDNLDDVKLHLVRFPLASRAEPQKGTPGPGQQLHMLRKCVDGARTPRYSQGSTDYGAFLQNEPSPLQPSTIVEKCTQKLVDEWNHLRAQACTQHFPVRICRSVMSSAQSLRLRGEITSRTR